MGFNGKGPWGDGPLDNGPNSNKTSGGNKRNNKKSEDDLEKILKESQEKIKRLIPGGGNGKNGDFKVVSLFLVVAALIVWSLSGIYTVNTTEEGIVKRFGEYARTAKPGINYHLPFPIETVDKINVTNRYKTEIGYRQNTSRNRFNRSAPRDMLMLTGDENIVDVNFEIQWQIADARKFLFNVGNPTLTVRDAAESAMREVIGTTPLNDILSEKRTDAQLRTKEYLQYILDSYDIGISIEEINMSAVPPSNSIRVENITTNEEGEMQTETITTTVDEAFKDVQAAIINKEEIINTAIARSNEVIPQARGQAQRKLQEAEGYKEQVIAKAEGETDRFLSVYNEYRKAKNVTRKRIYLETMEKIMVNMDKLIIDVDSGVVPYLPLNELKKNK